jgi:hypothetical protein
MHDLRNVSAKPLPAGYGTSDVVVRMIFTSFAGRAGWVPGIGAGSTVTATSPGPALAPGAVALMTFGPIPLPGCGMYQETLNAPGNKESRRFFVPGTTSIAATVAPPVPDVIDEDAPPKAYTITFTATGGPFWVFRPTQLPVMGSKGSLGDFTPRPVGRAAPPVAIYKTVYTVKPKNLHGRALCTDILKNFFDETVNSLVMAVSADGCFVQEVPLYISVRHPCQQD